MATWERNPLYGTIIAGSTIYRKAPAETFTNLLLYSFRHPTVRIFDRDDNLVGQIDPSVQNHPLLSMKCDVVEHGPGSFELVTNQRLETWLGDRITEEDGVYHFKVDLHCFGELQPCYRGWIYEEQYQSDGREYKYKGWGLVEHLKAIILFDDDAGSWGGRKEFQKGVGSGADAVDIVKWILTELSTGNRTKMSADDSFIQDPSYELEHYVIDHDKADKALDDIAKIVFNWDWYIDTSNRLHFLEDEGLTQATIVEGIGCESFTLTKDYRQIRNVFHVKVGLFQASPGGSPETVDTNFLDDGKATKTYDSDSVTDYGNRETVLTAPNIFDELDAWRVLAGPIIKGWAAAKAAEAADPITKAKLKNVQLTETIPALGNVRILTARGEDWEPEAAEYALEIKKISYKLSGDLGVQIDIDLGALDMILPEEILEIVRAIQNQELLESLNNMQLA